MLGASTVGLLGLLSRGFPRLVLLSLLIAVPLAWFLMQRWLEDFAYRAPISPWIFLAAGLTAVGIALLTISYQTLRTARANPVRALRGE